VEGEVLSCGMIRRDSNLTKLPALGKATFLFFLTSSLILILFGLPTQNSVAARKIRVVTSVFPLFDFAQAVLGERGEVSLLLPPGAETHTWQPRPSDIIRLSSADLFIYIGADLEPWLEDLLKSVKNPGLRVLEASRGIPLIDEEGTIHEGHEPEEEGIVHSEQTHEHGARDPHIWLDFMIDQIIVDKIATALSEIDPEGSSIFKKNASAYKKKLQGLDQKFKSGLKDCMHRTIILGGHAAFGYLARSYNLSQVSIYGLSPDSRPTPKKLVEVVELAKKYRIKVIFFEVYVRDELAKVLAEEVGSQNSCLKSRSKPDKRTIEVRKEFF
jgi:zinc transport system substrate-binding protein